MEWLPGRMEAAVPLGSCFPSQLPLHKQPCALKLRSSEWLDLFLESQEPWSRLQRMIYKLQRLSLPCLCRWDFVYASLDALKALHIFLPFLSLPQPSPFLMLGIPGLSQPLQERAGMLQVAVGPSPSTEMLPGCVPFTLAFPILLSCLLLAPLPSPVTTFGPRGFFGTLFCPIPVVGGCLYPSEATLKAWPH